MRKYLFPFLALLLLSFSADKAPKLYSELDKALKHPEKVERLDLGEYSLNHKKLPESLKTFVNLRELSLKAPKASEENQYGHARHYAVENYQKASLNSLPEWLTELQKLERITLAGNPQLNNPKELQKLVGVSSLRYLEIHPEDQISDEMYTVIGQFEQLEVLKIEDNRTLKLTELDLLETLLPNCKIAYMNYENDRD